jgi:hypothetical protein
MKGGKVHEFIKIPSLSKDIQGTENTHQRFRENDPDPLGELRRGCGVFFLFALFQFRGSNSSFRLLLCILKYVHTYRKLNWLISEDFIR